MQMTSFERKRIRLCVMTGFLESGNTQTELLRPRGAYRPHGNPTQYFIRASEMQTEVKYQTPENEQPSLFPFPTSFDDSFESPSFGWARPTQTLINEDIYKVWPGKG